MAVATSGNSINWFVLGEMNKDGQHFRDEIYACASNAHNSVDRGCGKYYRGTNAVHVKGFIMILSNLCILIIITH